MLRPLIVLTLLAFAAGPQEPSSSPVPPQAPDSAPVAPAPVSPPGQPAQAPLPAEPAPPFEAWLEDLVAEARARGFSDALIAETLEGLQPLPRVIQSDRSQAELTPGFSRYLSSRLTTPMVRRGRELAAGHAALLRRIEQRFGVPPRLLLAIWGVESRYGRLTGRTPVFRALATLAWEPRRAAYFRGELFDALTMVARGHIEARTMTGSWAGAMGQTQFMPSSYLRHAVDFDGDGHRDIWGSTPDALASIASYLAGYGWTAGWTWGREVAVSPEARATIAATVPRRVQGCYAIRNMTERMPLAEWQALGVRLADGRPLPTADVTAGLVDVGERQFLVYPNYDAILGYNCAHYYALSAALLSDAIESGPPAAGGQKTAARKPATRSARPRANANKNPAVRRKR